MKNLKLCICDFWEGFDPSDNYFYDLLSQKYKITFDNQNPDLTIYSLFGNHHYSITTGKKIFYTAENWNIVNNYKSDLKLGFDKVETSNSIYFPLWAMYINWFNKPYREDRNIGYLMNLQDLCRERKNYNKSKFCSFIVSNPVNNFRNAFFQMMNRCKRVDSVGKVYTNATQLSGRNDTHHKLDFLKQYKFNIAFENSSSLGYCTEKIVHSFYCGTIPIYWGDTTVDDYFESNCFINANKMKWNDIVDLCLKIDNNEDLRMSFLAHNPIKMSFLETIEPNKILQKIETVI